MTTNLHKTYHDGAQGAVRRPAYAVLNKPRILYGWVFGIQVREITILFFEKLRLVLK